MNIPKYSKLFTQIVRETSVRESDCPGNVLNGKRLYPGKWLFGKSLVRETSCPGNVCLGKWLTGKYPLPPRNGDFSIF